MKCSQCGQKKPMYIIVLGDSGLENHCDDCVNEEVEKMINETSRYNLEDAQEINESCEHCSGTKVLFKREVLTQIQF
jgi:hypothetical protein